jgi:RNase P subunit RPR2
MYQRYSIFELESRTQDSRDHESFQVKRQRLAIVEEVIEKLIGNKFHICDKCRYERGFHVSFERKDDHHEIVLICPSCGQRYRVGWKVTSTEIA